MEKRNSQVKEMPPPHMGNDPIISRVNDKWGKASIAGFQPVPDLLLKHQATLDLTTTDIIVLLNVLMHWWYPEKMPFPRSTTIARRMGAHVRTVQRSLRRMEELKLLTRKAHKDGPTYINPKPLVERLGELAEHDKHYLIRIERFDVA